MNHLTSSQFDQKSRGLHRAQNQAQQRVILSCRIFWKTLPRKQSADSGIHLFMLVSLMRPLLKTSRPLKIFSMAWEYCPMYFLLCGKMILFLNFKGSYNYLFVAQNFVGFDSSSMNFLPNDSSKGCACLDVKLQLTLLDQNVSFLNLMANSGNSSAFILRFVRLFSLPLGRCEIGLTPLPFSLQQAGKMQGGI